MVVQQNYEGEVDKSIAFVLHAVSIYSLPNIAEEYQKSVNIIDTTVK